MKMKRVEEGKLKYGTIMSEGKMFEVTPIFEDASGQPYMLPPAVWHVENWFLGFEDWHAIAMPSVYMSNERTYLMSSNAARSVRFWFMVRVLEDADQPEAHKYVIDAEAVKHMLEQLKSA